MKRRFVAIFVVVLLAVLAGCSGGDSASDSQGGTQPQTGANGSDQGSKASDSQKDGNDASAANLYAKKLDITWWGQNQNGLLPKDDTYVEKQMEKMFNVNIETVKSDNTNTDQLNVMLATGTQFDIFTQGKNVQSMYDTGLIREIPLSMIEKYMPQVLGMLKQASPNDEWKQVSVLDGKIYGIPIVNVLYPVPVSLVTRSDWMKAVGVTQVPQTMQQLEDLLLKYRNDDPDGNGKKDTYGLDKFGGTTDDMSSVAPYVFASYGIDVINQWKLDASGRLIYGFQDDGFKQATAKLADWYKKGILDPEIVLDKRQELMAKYSSGKVGAFFQTDAWTNSAVNTPVGMLLQKNPNATPVIIPPVSVNGQPGVTYRFLYAVPDHPMIYFGKNTSDEKMIRLMQMLEQIYTDKNLYAMVEYGQKGVDFDYTNDGTVEYKAGKGTAQNFTDTGATLFLQQNFIPPAMVDLRLYKERKVTYQQTKDFKAIPQSPYMQAVPSEQKYGAALDKIEKEYFWKAVSGQIDANTSWDSYQQKWEAAGGKTMVAEKNAAYEKWKNENK